MLTLSMLDRHYYRLLVLLLSLIAYPLSLFATHQRAAEITYRHLSGLTYEITLISYTYTPSPANAFRDFLTIHWGDGTITEGVVVPERWGGEAFGSHTYEDAGIYTIVLTVQDDDGATSNAAVVTITAGSGNVPPVAAPDSATTDTEAATIIIDIDLIIWTTPSSLVNTTKLAIQGKNIARTTEATTSCPGLNARGANRPMATSLRKNPIIRAVTASFGRPKSFTTTGEANRAMASMIPRE